MKAMRLLSGMLFFLLILTISCKKEEINDNTQEFPNYSQLKVGNYWVYERVRIEPDGTEIVEGIDSCYISRDTVIRGNTYYEYVRPDFNEYYKHLLRDSLQYIVDERGKLYFSSNETDVVLIDEILDETIAYTRELIPGIKEITVPAGTFNAYQVKETYYITTPSGNSEDRYNYYNYYYAENIGIVKENAPKFSMQSHNNERRLIRYYVGE